MKKPVFLLFILQKSRVIFSDFRKIIAWLKSLRPQPHWKPTEEQIKGLKFFLDFHRPQRNAGTTNWKEFDAVESLYNDIRKL